MPLARASGSGYPHADTQVLTLDSKGENYNPPHSSRPTSSSGRSKSNRPSEFRKHLENEELPLRIETEPDGQRRVVWLANLENMDFIHFLPLCLTGIQDPLEPYATFAYDATMQLLEHGIHDKRVLRTLPQVMTVIKGALSTREKHIVHRMLPILQQLVVCDGVGSAISDYYRAVLPLCNILQDKHLGTGDERTKALVLDTLETMECYGKDEAHLLIQQYVPTYQQTCGPEQRGT